MQRQAFASVSLLDQLEASLAHETLARRVETLRRVTDLFLGRCVEYSDDQIAVFDDVFQFLVQKVEASSRVLLAQRLAPVASAPPQIIRALALDDLIEVAAPALAQSERLDDDALIEAARSKTQDHLLAISTRHRISSAVTDVLVERGNDDVVTSTARNPGAAFSEHGFSTLVTRAEHCDLVAECVGLRQDIPRHHYLKLIAKASDAVRATLEAAHPDARRDVQTAVREATRKIRTAKDAFSSATDIAHALVRSLYEDGRLDEAEVAQFADDEKFDEANAAIACLARIPLDLAETIMIEARIEGIFILAKVCNFAWPTVQSIIAMRAKLSNLVPTETTAHREAYARLRQSTAHQVLRFHRMQQSTAEAAHAI